MTEIVRTVKYRTTRDHHLEYPHGGIRSYKSEQHLISVLRHYIHAASGIIAVTVDGEHVWHYERGFSEKWLKAHPILADCTGLSARQSFDRDAFMNENGRENFIDQHGFAP